MTPGVRHKGIFTRTAAHYMALSSTCPKLSESCGRSELEDPGVDLALNPTASEPSSEPELVRTGYSPFRNYLLLGDPAVRLTASDVRGNVKTTGIEGAGDATVDWAGREDLNLRPCAPKAGQNLPSNSGKLLKIQARLVEQPLQKAPAIGALNGTLPQVQRCHSSTNFSKHLIGRNNVRGQMSDLPTHRSCGFPWREFREPTASNFRFARHPLGIMRVKTTGCDIEALFRPTRRFGSFAVLPVVRRTLQNL